jgi:O-antigen/teichoic acid export membrane protein
LSETPRSEAEQAGALVWGRIATTAAEAITPIVIVRLLDRAEVGQLASIWLIYSTVAILLSAGFPNAVLYFLADGSRGRRRQVVRRMSEVMIAMGAIAAVALIVLAGSDPRLLDGLSASGGSGADPNALGLLPLMAAYAVFDLPTRLMPNVLVAEGRARASATVETAFSVARVIATLIPALLGFGVAGIVLGLLAVSIARALAFYAFTRVLYRGAESDGIAVGFKALIAYSIPLGATQITNTLNSGLDQWLILLQFPADEMAVYKTGAYQIPVLTTVAFSVGAVYLPRFARLFSDGRGREALELWRASIPKVALIVVPAALFFMVAAEEFVTVAFTDEYLGAAHVFRAYCFLVVLRVAAFGNVMLAAGRPGLVLRASVLSLASNAVLSVPLLFLVGFYGPALGTAAAFVPTLIFYNYFIARAVGVRLRDTFPLRDYLRVLSIAAVPAAVALGLKLALDVPPLALLVLEAATVLVGWSLIGTASGLITREDWAFVRRWLGLSSRRRPHVD